MIICLNLLKNIYKKKNKLRLYNILHISILHVYNESYIHNIGMVTNMLAVSCLPAYRTIAWWAIAIPDQSAKLAVIYCFSHFTWQAVPDPGPIMDKWFKSIFRRVALGTTAVLSFRMEYWEHFSFVYLSVYLLLSFFLKIVFTV